MWRQTWSIWKWGQGVTGRWQQWIALLLCCSFATPVPCAQVLEPFHLEGAGNTKRRTSWAICQAFQVSSKKRRGAETGDIASGVASTSLIELTIAELANDASWRWIIIAHGCTIVWASSTTSISTCCSSTVWWLFSSLWSLCQRQCGELLRSLLLS